MERAKFSLRVLATSIDFLVVVVLVCVVAAVSDTERVVQVVDVFELDGQQTGAGRFDIKVWFGVIALYSLMELTSGGTLGKRVFRLHILNGDESKPSLGKLFARWCFRRAGAIVCCGSWLVADPLLLLVGVVLAVILGLGSLLAARERKQALHDMLARTAVYRVPLSS